MSQCWRLYRQPGCGIDVLGRGRSHELQNVAQRICSRLVLDSRRARRNGKCQIWRQYGNHDKEVLKHTASENWGNHLANGNEVDEPASEHEM